MEEALGLESGRVALVPHDTRWTSLFEKLAEDLQVALRGRVGQIHHVGSTSVPGLAAKPILDILVGVPDLEDSRGLFPDLARFGFEYRADEEIPDRHYFRKRQGTRRTHHLSLAEPTSLHYTATLAFRDALRGDRQLAKNYERLKRALAAQYPFDREAYQAGKTGFVMEVLRRGP